jgi:hypothetical protein
MSQNTIKHRLVLSSKRATHSRNSIPMAKKPLPLRPHGLHHNFKKRIIWNELQTYLECKFFHCAQQCISWNKNNCHRNQQNGEYFEKLWFIFVQLQHASVFVIVAVAAFCAGTEANNDRTRQPSIPGSYIPPSKSIFQAFKHSSILYCESTDCESVWLNSLRTDLEKWFNCG